MGATVMKGQQLVDELKRRIALAETNPDYPKRQDRRSHVRYEPVSASVDVVVVSRDESVRHATLVDVCADGVRIVLDSPPRVGEVVRLLFDLGDARIEINGEVYHEGNDNRIRYVGLRFTDALVGPPAPVPAAEDSD